MFSPSKSAENALEKAIWALERARDCVEAAADRLASERDRDHGDEPDLSRVTGRIDHEFERAQNKLASAERALEDVPEDEPGDPGKLRADRASRIVRRARLRARAVARVTDAIGDGDRDPDALDELGAELDSLEAELQEAGRDLEDLANADPADLQPDDVAALRNEVKDLREELAAVRATDED